MSLKILAILFLIFSLNSAWIYEQSSKWVSGEYGYHGVHDGAEDRSVVADEWAVHIEGGDEVAQLVAMQLGYEYHGPVAGFPYIYAFSSDRHAKKRRTPSSSAHPLKQDRRVKWAHPLYEKSRVKRGVIPEATEEPELHRVKRVEVQRLGNQRVEGQRVENQRVKREKCIIHAFKTTDDNERISFNDPLWAHEWYLEDTQSHPWLPRLDLNVMPVYKKGYSGRGIRVSVLDDGIEHTHTDLRDNYDPEISWDSNDGDPDPSPRYTPRKLNSHGTRCAGEIAMIANNVKCGVGVAWGAKVGGVRMLDGRITDIIEGEAVGYAWDKVDIYSASWGPNDDGRTLEGPGPIAMEAFKRGVTQGRRGKGIIYVWANGNGGGNHDNCNCDGFSSSRYTISIGSAAQDGLFPWYGETCSSTLAVAYSSGAVKDQKIATTDTGDSCTLDHTGTSAAAPLAAGIIALVLEANPSLTWRDVQHLIVWTSEVAPLADSPGWIQNAAGFRFDVRFGFGLLNAAALVEEALYWKTVPEYYTCYSKNIAENAYEGRFEGRDIIEVELDISNCSVRFIEHVELITTIQYSRRGALQMFLKSPQDTEVQIMSPRPKDDSIAGFRNWPLMSVATWGEDPRGPWKLTLRDETPKNRNPSYDNRGVIESVELVIHGTKEIPKYMRNGPRIYNKYCNSIPELVDYYYSKLKSQVVPKVDRFGNPIIDDLEKQLVRIYHMNQRHNWPNRKIAYG